VGQGGTVKVGDYSFFYGKGKKSSVGNRVFLYITK
jgi:hypothetical protein